ncbi:MAG: UDP-N-acetylmuramoyl-L-alanyl-D-glutamate--2,6-diaminopimelate ligase [Armatimonadetes bacterium]|nr:UDP-N-acetylmuramoyl-L-alanyl-D-glutamate--2,6-diaminopimelate ligase [Armatimonadota bacterium]MDW8121078.1 UDP-N-acetylmuramoyl-L-alanyl-D-glutamate--2,6-diaminopimelate ligase [Armatimonadota bacterium]
MKLKDLVQALPDFHWRGDDAWISSITHDSRRVQPGALFVCLSGLHQDGHHFVTEALQKGAAAVVAERSVDTGSAPLIQVPDTRLALSLLAHRFYGEPTKFLTVIGVTGTNGKTTTTYLIAHILNQFSGRPIAAVLGTTGIRLGNQSFPLNQTTPDAPELFRWIAWAKDTGAQFLVMEVSSHALEQRRCDACLFDIAVFTNLSHDHLDYHHDLESYFFAKARLFTDLADHSLQNGKNYLALVNADDPFGQRLLKIALGKIRTYATVGDGDYTVHNISVSGSGISFRLQTKTLSLPLSSSLLGRFNVMNVLAASAVALELGVPPEALSDALLSFQPPPGRLERVDVGQPFLVLVDYAHTPDALDKVLDAVREVTSGRVIVVFGCGGDRDPMKRPQMGRIATTKADLTIVTSDNPRTEDPMKIIEQIIAGIEKGSPFIIQPDRRTAIKTAVQMAQRGDVVLIAGKGHEDYQIIGRQKIPFSDRLVALEALQERYGVSHNDKH